MARAIDEADALKHAIPVRGEYDDSGVFDAVPVGYIKGSPTIDPVKQEWISVKDRLPEKCQDVICYTIADLMDVYTWTGEKWEDSYGYYEDDDIITHWMPLPEPPERNGE